MGTRSGGARARGFGAEIRERRNSLGWTMEHVVTQVGMSKPTLSRIENGQRACTSHEAVSILTVLGVTGAERERLVNLTRPDDQQSWLGVGGEQAQQYRAFVTFERQATSITDVSPALLPGLLQTPGYVRALFNEGPLTGEAMENAISARTGRQSTLSRPSLRRYAALLDEVVLVRIAGDSAVAREQLKHLINLGDSEHVSIRFIPFGAGYHRGCDGGFSIFDFNEAQPRVVYLENQTAGVFVDEPQNTRPYIDIVESMSDKVLDDCASRDLLERYFGEAG